MGIQGLLPFLKKIHTPVNVAQFKGCTVAIDAYCWLHKGAFSCADKLALGEKTEQYVYYCMKYVDYLLRSGLRPILVFDGCHLPSKKGVETSRRAKRELNRKKAAQLLREGKRAEARECLQRCIDISPQMALELMNACRARGVDCIVAPYEADAQLAFLSKAGIAQIIITEDSDLLLFGCDKVIFKMDFFGNGVLIERSRLNEVVDLGDGFYTFDKFRYMCILSGCDYLPSLPGIGLVKASKVFKVARQTDLRQLLKKLPTYVKMNLVVSSEYIEGFLQADNTFLYQLVFDPLTRTLCPLTPYAPEVEIENLRYAGPYFSDQLGLQIALGNVDIHTNERIANFDPETFTPKCAKKGGSGVPGGVSIWKRGYRPGCQSDASADVHFDGAPSPSRPCLWGKEIQVKNTLPKRSPAKRCVEVEDSADVKTNSELTHLYAAPSSKRRKCDADKNNGSTPPNPFDSDEEGDNNKVKTKERDSPARKQALSPFDSDEEGDRMKATRRESSTTDKKVLSPSKSANRAGNERSAMSTDEAFALMEQETEVTVTVMPEEKENGKQKATPPPPPKRNKFAVSALAKRARFCLDSPALPHVKVEVKSRYFSGSNTSSPSAAGDSGTLTGRACDAEETSSNPLSHETKETSPQPMAAKASPASAADQTLSRETQSVREKKDGSVLSKFSFTSPNRSSSNKATDGSVLSKFSFTSPNRSSSSKATDHATSTASARSKDVKGGNKKKSASNASPGSAFSWASFKFTKSVSLPGPSAALPASAGSSQPFKRVMSETDSSKDPSSTPSSSLPGSSRPFVRNVFENSKGVSSSTSSSPHQGRSKPSGVIVSESQDNGYESISSQQKADSSIDERGHPSKNDSLDEKGYSGANSKSKRDDEDTKDTDSLPIDSQKSADSWRVDEGESCVLSQGSVSTAGDVDGSQRSNLCSLDSDCFPTSQDFVDLTDCDGDSQPDSQRSSPLWGSQASLKSTQSTPRFASSGSGVGAKKCRVSGLSRGKKKAPPGGDEKQQKIRDMFSRFAHQKSQNVNPVSQSADCEEETPEGTDHGTPSNYLLSSTRTHRKLSLK